MKSLHMCLCALIFLCTLSCEKDDCSGIDCLPPITQTGAGTFGCLVNGKPFIDNSGEFNCFYQITNGEYNFSIAATKNGFLPRAIQIGSRNKQIFQNSTFQLLEREPNKLFATVIFNNINNNQNIDTTDSVQNGSITITKLDLQAKIISASFQFTVTDSSNGEVYHITEGRFDSIFTP